MQGKLDLPVVFAAMAAAVRQFKREPTIAEFEMCRQCDKDFPAYKSVIGHFENKAQMTGALRAWAENTEGYGDIVELLPATVEHARAISSPAPKEGYVYLIKSGAFYKIGRGDELEKRVKQIRVALPDASTLEHSIKTDDPAGIEAYWHRRFDVKRANGEWFKLSLQDVAAFKRRKYQ
ncbi:MAG: GIY-YIG nuclease family protein [Fimbriimonadaceae bacterium]|nr:GIY-YIG nuclease family protein [Alphaproteobacteria bacterium]